MELTSPAFEHHQSIPKRYTCEGEDINPPLKITGIPKGTKSLILIMDDPDAPNGTWDHWIVWNIAPAEQIQEDSVPAGAVQGKNSWGKREYGGPCPPSGTHRYFFKLYALDTPLTLGADATKQELLKAIGGSPLGYAELVGTYQKGKK
jgi:Raf kinase inhibitor-like YbhB/YbcL family protein